MHFTKVPSSLAAGYLLKSRGTGQNGNNEIGNRLFFESEMPDNIKRIRFWLNTHSD